MWRVLCRITNGSDNEIPLDVHHQYWPILVLSPTNRPMLSLSGFRHRRGVVVVFAGRWGLLCWCTRSRMWLWECGSSPHPKRCGCGCNWGLLQCFGLWCAPESTAELRAAAAQFKVICAPYALLNFVELSLQRLPNAVPASLLDREPRPAGGK